MSKTSNRFSPEVRAQAVRLVFDHEKEYRSRWAAVSSIAAKIGCTAHRRTLIVPEGHAVDADLIEVGTFTRREVDQVVVAYSFDLRTNQLATTQVANPNAGREHVFKAYRVAGDPAEAVTLRACNQILAGLGAADAALEDDED
jgi:hypothetical protein